MNSPLSFPSLLLYRRIELGKRRCPHPPSAPVVRRRQTITQAAHRGYEIGAELAAQAADEYLDGVRIAVEVLAVDVLGQLGARHDLALVVHQGGQQAVFLGG